MEKSVYFVLFTATLTTVLHKVHAASPWIDYMVTVEQPVTLVTHNRVTRQNGTCCSPIDSTDCNNICPDDPSVAFKLVVCFRGGFVIGYSTDAEYCPLGALRDFAPNSAPGVQWALTPRPEAATLERQYPGSVQLLVRITAIVNGQEVHVDDVWVFGQTIPADGTFRRITYLSMKQIAIVGVNARVNCTNGATSADCSFSNSTQSTANYSEMTESPTSTETNCTDGTSTADCSFSNSTQSTANYSEVTESPATTEMNCTNGADCSFSNSTQSTVNYSESTETVTNQNTTLKDTLQGEASSDTISPVSIVIGLCIGAALATAVTILLSCAICCWKFKHMKKQVPLIGDAHEPTTMNRNPVYNTQTLPALPNTVDEDEQLYEEV